MKPDRVDLSVDQERGINPALAAPSWPFHGSPVVLVSGDVDGHHLDRLLVLLDHLAVGLERGSRIVLDVSGVERWSIVTQGVIAGRASMLRRRGVELVLYAPSLELRRQSAACDIFSLDLFARVRTVDAVLRDPELRGPGPAESPVRE